MKKVFIPLVLFLVMIIVFVFIFLKRVKPVRFSGYFEAEEIVLSLKISSRVIKISKKEGEKIKKGEEILILDSREIENKLNEAEKKISAKEEKLKSLDIKIKRLKKDLLSLKEIYEKGGGRKKEIEHLEDEIETLGYERNSILKEISAFYEEIKNLKILKEETIVKSPCEGKINEIYYEKGELVNPGFPLVKIIKTDTLEFIFFLTQKYLPYLKDKHTILIKPTPFESFYKGEIYFISEKAEFTPKNIVTESEKERMVFKVKAKVFNKDEVLRPGMTGYVEWKR